MMGISGLILLVFMSSAILLNAAEQEEIPQQNMPGENKEQEIIDALLELHRKPINPCAREHHLCLTCGFRTDKKDIMAAHIRVYHRRKPRPQELPINKQRRSALPKNAAKHLPS